MIVMKKIFLKILEFVITKTMSLYLVLNKKKHVSYKSYYKSGVLKSQLFNDKSKKEYYDNGSLRYETDAEGNSKSYFPNGEIETEFIVRGNITKYYDYDGNLKEENKSGETIQYYSTGEIWKKYAFGRVEEYYKNGNPTCIHHHILIHLDEFGNKLHGNKKIYYSGRDTPLKFGPGCIPPEDKLIKENHFKHGLLHGIQLEWDEFGDYLESETQYRYGVRHGYEKLYHDNGKISSLTNYREGKLYGVSKSWYKNGQLEYDYFHGNDSYPEKYWDENGKEIKN
tara:strand:- start:9444 stop:10289 length:846 start_codon:yes stop_codon:yes gene_type:complete